MLPQPRYDDPGATVRFLGRLMFERAKGDPARFHAFLPEPGTMGLRFLILFDGKDYPFEQHYMYARHRGEGTPHTFSNTEFATNPPGLRVGPWPGWRGIPLFPSVTLSAEGNVMPVTLFPWGDELTCRTIRGGATSRSHPSGELTCTVSDVRLRPVCADLYACRPLSVVPVPVTLLPGLLGTHPRLLVAPGDIPGLRKRAESSHRRHWGRVMDLLYSVSLPWEITPESKVPPGPERLRGEDRALMASFVAMVDPSPSHRALARASLLAFIHETQRSDYEPLSIDTQAGETLFILSLCYDWTYDQWSQEERNGIGEWLWNVADICWSHLGNERQDYGQAHYLGCALGLLAFSFLFWEDHPRARGWVAHCRGVLDLLLTMLPQDGFYPHGINLWIYEHGFLLRWLELFRACAGEDLWRATDYWRSSSLFRAASTSPDGRYGITFGDPQYRVGGDSWCHYLVASRTRSPYAQWLGEMLLEGPPEGVDFRHVPPRRSVYEFLFYDPEVPAEEFAKSIQVFPDGGQLFVRRSGKHPALFTFRAGPPLGRQRYAAGEHGGYGHADPANGSFLLLLGDRFAVSGPGPTYRRETAMHNTITIDGQGQIGDSTVWLPDFLPPEVLCPTGHFRTDGSGMTISTTLAPTYLPHLEVEECHRALWVDLERCIVGVDTVRCRHPRSIEWNIHGSSTPLQQQSENAIAFNLTAAGHFCRLVVLDPLNTPSETGLTEMVPAYPHDGTRTTYLRLTVKGTEACFIWCLLLDPGRGAPHLLPGDERLTIRFESGLTLVYHNGFLTMEESDDNSPR